LGIGTRMNKDPLFSAKLKLEGAKRHIGDLAGHIKAFFGTEPYPIATSVEAEPEGPQQVLKVKITKPLSNEIYACAGDALHNLRSVLDHLACALAIQNGHSDPGKTEFPIVGGENWLDDPGTKKKIKLISAEANALIRDLKPYKGGDNILWALNRLRVTDTHKTVVPIGSALLGISGQMIMKPSGIGVHTFETPRWCRFNENMEALICASPRPTTSSQILTSTLT